ncbi:MAG: hypothetical protein JXB32_25255 [Deltaproteobacteria bacterium]|nr:hypothetical protein [Deltaproteobacteria bacterium]
MSKPGRPGLLALILAISALVTAACDPQQVLLGTEPDATDESGGPDAAADADAEDGDDRPTPPPIGDAGDTGWGDSDAPWLPEPDEVTICEGFGSTQLDLWAGDDGVYVAWSWMEIDHPEGGPWHAGPAHGRIDFNDGTGWSQRWASDRDVGTTWTSGVMVYDMVGRIGDRIATRLAHPDRLPACSWMLVGLWTSSPWEGLPQTASQPFVVDDDLAYAVWPDDAAGDTKMIRWDGATWGVVPAVLPYDRVSLVWADEDDLFVAGERGTVLSLEGDSWRVLDAGTLDNIVAIWGFGPDDLWLGTIRGGLRHFDGASWTAPEWPDRALEDGDDPRPILGMTGADGVLFFLTRRQVTRWDGTAFDVLGYWHSRSSDLAPFLLKAIAARSPSELFVAAAQPDGDFYATDMCLNRPFVMRWDGAVWHWM